MNFQIDVPLPAVVDPPMYQRMAQEPARLHGLGFSDHAIAVRLGVTDNWLVAANRNDVTPRRSFTGAVLGETAARCSQTLSRSQARSSVRPIGGAVESSLFRDKAFSSSVVRMVSRRMVEAPR